MNKNMMKWIIIALCSTLLLSAGCTHITGAGNSRQGGPKIQSAQDPGQRMLDVTDQTSLPLETIDGKHYVEAKSLMQLLGYNLEWDDETKSLKIGDTDVIFELKPDSREARVEEETVYLQDPPVLRNEQTYLPVSVLSDLLMEDLSFTERDGQLVLQPNPDFLPINMDEDADIPLPDEFNFAEDPNDPFKNEQPEDTAEEDQAAVFPLSPEELGDYGAIDGDAVPVLKNINVSSLIARAKKYLGVKYQFGAKPYPQSSRFDCSSFVQYIYGKYGVSMPRTARAQAKKGVAVSRKNLRRGDLLFFYVPGRFKSNKTVGHVGIYIGNNQMIHASPKPKNGVQITNINKAYWKKTYLKARRVVY